jgi:hypothetical protein
MDEAILRMRYEILGQSFDEIASGEEYSSDFLEKFAEQHGWRRVFDPVRPEQGNEEEFIEESRKRLEVYEAAKGLYFAGKYAAVEGHILGRLSSSFAMESMSPNELRTLTATLNALQGPAKKKTDQDDDGVPTVILKDFRGEDS